jgi:similar to spore coat protein
MSEQNISLHEAMEVHEMLNFKTICMTKSKMMQGLVFDQDLKALLGQDVEQSIKAINTLQGLLAKAPTQG